MIRKAYALPPVPPGRKRRKRTKLPPCSRVVHMPGGQCRIVYAPWKALRDFNSVELLPLPDFCVTHSTHAQQDLCKAKAAHLLHTLRSLCDFPTQYRPRVCSIPVEGLVLGKAQVFDKRGSNGHRPIVYKNTHATQKYYYLWKAASDFIKTVHPVAKFTTVQINKCTKPCALHVDRRNVGSSYIVALGSFSSGGELQLLNFKLNIHNKVLTFNGQLPHRAIPHTGGDRYSLVYFNAGKTQGCVQSREKSADLIGICADPSTLRLSTTGW